MTLEDKFPYYKNIFSQKIVEDFIKYQISSMTLTYFFIKSSTPNIQFNNIKLQGLGNNFLFKKFLIEDKKIQYRKIISNKF